MPNLIRIIYISRTNLPAMDTTSEIDPNIARILAKSRSNNRKNGLVGVLYFGDGCFFQCLEGEETTVDTLYEKLLKDPRHKDLKLISRKQISKLSFPDWAMKYVKLEDEMKRLLALHGLDTFNPYEFNAEMTQSVMKLLHGASAVSENESEEFSASTTINKEADTNKHNKLLQRAIYMSSIALVISISTLLLVVFLISPHG